MYLFFCFFFLMNSINGIFSFTPNTNHKFIIVHKIKNEGCGQAKIKDIYFEKANYFSNVQKGSCSSCGYKKYIGKETHIFPFIGKVVIFKYKKDELKENDCTNDLCDI